MKALNAFLLTSIYNLRLSSTIFAKSKCGIGLYFKKYFMALTQFFCSSVKSEIPSACLFSSEKLSTITVTARFIIKMQPITINEMK